MLGNGAETDEGIGRRSQGPCDEYPAAFHTVSWMQGENLGATVWIGLLPKVVCEQNRLGERWADSPLPTSALSLSRGSHEGK